MPSLLKRAVAIGCDGLGLTRAGLLAQRRFAGPHLRAVYYHDLAPAMSGAFEDQLRFLAAHFVPAVRADIDCLLDGGGWPHPKPGLLLTFDDGLRSHHELVAPLLEKYGFQGWFFVPVGLIGLPAAQQPAAAQRQLVPHCCDTSADPRIFMTAAQVRDLASRHVVACHTSMHVRLASNLGAEALRTEILEARDALERMIERPVEAFAWVGGEEPAYSQAAAALLRNAFRYVFRTNTRAIDATASRHALDRTHLEAWFTPSLLRFQLCGAMDLLYAPKRARLARRLGDVTAVAR
jgi:peptidoglycan/xylan/chitin deacetylase (PgdA/CDA1 family)